MYTFYAAPIHHLPRLQYEEQKRIHVLIHYTHARVSSSDTIHLIVSYNIIRVYVLQSTTCDAFNKERSAVILVSHASSDIGVRRSDVVAKTDSPSGLNFIYTLRRSTYFFVCTCKITAVKTCINESSQHTR